MWGEDTRSGADVQISSAVEQAQTEIDRRVPDVLRVI
jgi:hypothetical protein